MTVNNAIETMIQQMRKITELVDNLETGSNFDDTEIKGNIEELKGLIDSSNTAIDNLTTKVNNNKTSIEYISTSINRIDGDITNLNTIVDNNKKEVEENKKNTDDSIIKIVKGDKKNNDTVESVITELQTIGDNYKSIIAIATTLKTFLESKDITDDTINTWREIYEFLEGIKDNESLIDIIENLTQDIETNVNAIEDIKDEIKNINTKFTNGTANQFRKGDGSLDSTKYVISNTLYGENVLLEIDKVTKSGIYRLGTITETINNYQYSNGQLFVINGGESDINITQVIFSRQDVATPPSIRVGSLNSSTNTVIWKDWQSLVLSKDNPFNGNVNYNNINSCTKTGYYLIQRGVTNKYSTLENILLVLDTNNIIRQVYIGLDENGYFVHQRREYINDEWSEWITDKINGTNIVDKSIDNTKLADNAKITYLGIEGVNNNIFSISAQGINKTIDIFKGGIKNYGYRDVNKNDNAGYPTITLIADITNLINGTDSKHYGFLGKAIDIRNSGYPIAKTVFISALIGYNTSYPILYTSHENITPLIVKRNNNYYIGISISSSGRIIRLQGSFQNCFDTFEEILATNTSINRENPFPEINGIEYPFKDKTNLYYRFNVSNAELSKFINAQSKTGTTFNTDLNTISAYRIMDDYDTLPHRETANVIVNINRGPDGKYSSQLAFTSESPGIYFRTFSGKAQDVTTNWREFAFIDSNVASADKLTVKQLSNENLNNIKDNNFTTYYAAGGNTCTNTPENKLYPANAFGLQVSRISDGDYLQVLIQYHTGITYRRIYNGETNTWTPWVEILSSATKTLTNEDLDNIKDKNYTFYAGYYGNTCINKPANVTAFGLQVFPISFDAFSQILVSFNGSNNSIIYKRDYTTQRAAWSAWYKIAIEDGNLNANTLNSYKTDGINFYYNEYNITNLVSDADGNKYIKIRISQSYFRENYIIKLFLKGNNTYQDILLNTGSCIDNNFSGHCTKYNTGRVLGIFKKYQNNNGFCEFYIKVNSLITDINIKYDPLNKINTNDITNKALIVETGDYSSQSYIAIPECGMFATTMQAVRFVGTASNADSASSLSKTRLTNENLNNVKNTDFKIYELATDNKCTNTPNGTIGITGHLIIHGLSNTYIIQTFIETSGITYRRALTNNTWGSWKRMLTENDLTSLEARITALEARPNIVEVSSLPSNPEYNTLYCIPE